MTPGFNRYSIQKDEESSQREEIAGLQENLRLRMVDELESPVRATSAFLQFQAQMTTQPEQHGNQSSLLVNLIKCVHQQSKSITLLKDKVEEMHQRIINIAKAVKQIQNDSTANEIRELPNEQIETQQPKMIETETMTAKILKRVLFGHQQDYQYGLEIAQKLENPIYRERNFRIQVKLMDRKGVEVKNSNKISLSLALYTSESPPKFIEKNMAGQNILKGHADQSLQHGRCHFQKLQIREVTSHFRNGWIFIVILPCVKPLGGQKAKKENFVNEEKIEPLVLDNIIVKAKKLKESGPKALKCKLEQKSEGSKNGFPWSSDITPDRQSQLANNRKPNNFFD